MGNKLVFKFVQEGEFDDPRYAIVNPSGDWLGNLIYENGYWWVQFTSNFAHSQGVLREISEKLTELDRSLFNSRIFKLF